MRREIPAPIAFAVILVAVAIVAFLFWRVWTGRRQLSEEGVKIPAEVQQEFQRRMGSPSQPTQPSTPPTYIPPPTTR
jgi:FtsZ-interacting cell division protein ZipA